MSKYIALIGAGNRGKNYLRNLYDMGVLHCVLDKSKDIRKARPRVYPDINCVDDEDDILKNREIKAVVIAAPAHLHYGMTKKCLLAGKHILVEKPLALEYGDGKELVDIAERKKRILMVGYILHNHYAVRRLREIIDSGEIGDIRYIYSNRLNLGILRANENVLWSFAPHDISLILILMDNQEPLYVNAFGESYITGGVYDTTVTELGFRKRLKSHIFLSWLHPYKGTEICNHRQ